jgi:hypothetical protein
VKNYSSNNIKADYANWNTFISEAKNATFLFIDFMEYHKDRFDDFSVLIYENRKLVAVLPLIKLRMKFSLSRRTYGGLVYSSKINGEK